MAVEKSLYEAPQGLEALSQNEPDIEIEVEDPESVSINVAGMEIEIGKEVDEDFG